MFKRQPVTPGGIQRVAIDKSFSTSSVTIVSPDVSDKTTWWAGSQRVTDKVLPETDGLVYSFGDTNLINVESRYAGRHPVSALDFMTSGNAFYNPNDYRLVVKLDGNDISADEYGREAWENAAGKSFPFQVDYINGTLTFDSNQAGAEVKVSYSKADAFEFKVQPPSGEVWLVDYVEMQFSVDHGAWPGPVHMVPGLDALGGDLPPYRYNNVRDVIDVASDGHLVKAAGALTKDVQIQKWDYLTGFMLFPSDAVISPEFAASALNYMIVRLPVPEVVPACELFTAAFYIRREPLT